MAHPPSGGRIRNHDTSLAASWDAPSLTPAEKGTVLRPLVTSVVVTRQSVDIGIRADAVAAQLRSSDGTAAPRPDASLAEDGEVIALSVPATLKRVRMEMRHLINGRTRT